MHRDRITEAVEWLETVLETKARKFDLCMWGQFTHEETAAARAREPGVEDLASLALNHCGTKGCGLGWIASSPFAIQKGLHLTVDRSTGSADVSFKNLRNEKAGASYFGIQEDVAHWLFMPSQYPASTRCGKRALEEFIKRLEFTLVATPDMLVVAVDTEPYHQDRKLPILSVYQRFPNSTR